MGQIIKLNFQFLATSFQKIKFFDFCMCHFDKKFHYLQFFCQCVYKIAYISYKISYDFVPFKKFKSIPYSWSLGNLSMFKIKFNREKFISKSKFFVHYNITIFAFVVRDVFL